MKLKNNSYKLYILSNTNALHFKYLKNKFKILSEFDDYILSYRSGHRKPNPIIFKEITVPYAMRHD